MTYLHQPNTLKKTICKWFEKSFFERGLSPNEETDHVLGSKIERNVKNFILDYQKKTGMDSEKVDGTQNILL